LELSSRRAVVTGGSHGIGLVTARMLAEEGARVAIVARGPERLEHARAEVAQSAVGSEPIAVVADMRSQEDVEAMIEHVASEFGGVDILVNCAATPVAPGRGAKLGELSDDEVRAEIETKVLGYLRCARAAAPHMESAGWGRIVNVSGLASRLTGSLVGSIRNISVAAMTKNLADELGPSGINVTVVHPGMTVTERTPELIDGLVRSAGIEPAEAEAKLARGISIGRLISSEEVAAVITFLCSPRSVAINGDPIPVGGGSVGSIHY
jgi:NAD(P)-dependent dehydrogenase (short-subunit alcohol dehydrogenase family)